jgi:hypothetical protein
MTKFDELNKLFDPWRTQWIEQYRQHQRLPHLIAKRFQEFLGCPETFPDGTDDKNNVRYVSATDAKWNDATDNFTLTASDWPTGEVHFHEDGSFYFGLRVFLEHAPTTYPKEAFWFLLRTQFDGSGFTVWVQRSKQQFKLGASPNYETDALCEHLFDLLKADLAKSPMIQDRQDANKIGFT